MTKHCFVTVGATASFNALVAECLSDSVLRALQRHGYTHLLIQHGREPGAQEILRAFEARNADGWDTRANYGLDVEGYDLKDSLDDDMAMVKANQERNRHEGVIISHAGTFYVFWLEAKFNFTLRVKEGYGPFCLHPPLGPSTGFGMILFRFRNLACLLKALHEPDINSHANIAATAAAL